MKASTLDRCNFIVAVVAFIFFAGHQAENASATMPGTVATRKQAQVVPPGEVQKNSSAVTLFDEVSLPAARPVGKESRNEDTQLLLVFTAYPPHERKERPLYELAREIKAFVDSPRFPPTGVSTDKGIRYGVFAVKRVRVLKTTDSRRSPRSERPGAYVLALDPIYKICTKSYTVHTTRAGKRRITYTDCENGEAYEIPLRKRSPLTVYELEILTGDIFRQLWQEKVGRHR